MPASQGKYTLRKPCVNLSTVATVAPEGAPAFPYNYSFLVHVSAIAEFQPTYIFFSFFRLLSKLFCSNSQSVLCVGCYLFIIRKIKVT